MATIALTTASAETLRAYREWSALGEMAQTIVSDLESQIPGDFCPDNQYVTAYNLGQLRVLQIIGMRVAQAQTEQPSLPEQVSNGKDQHAE